MLAAVLHDRNPFFIGGRNSVGNGWGQFQNVAVIDYDFTQPGKLKEFLLRKGTEKEFIEALSKQGNHEVSENPVDTPKNPLLQLDYTITFRDAFLINDPEAESDDDEAEFNFFTVNGKYAFPGSSIKGVIRHRSK